MPKSPTAKWLKVKSGKLEVRGDFVKATKKEDVERFARILSIILDDEPEAPKEDMELFIMRGLYACDLDLVPHSGALEE
jgi:hypothetical protein